jgi:hypothetical protein
MIVEGKGFLREALEFCKYEKQMIAAEIAAKDIPFPKWVSKQRPVFDIAVQENLYVGAHFVPNTPRSYLWSYMATRYPRDLWWLLRSPRIAEASDVINAVSHLETANTVLVVRCGPRQRRLVKLLASEGLKILKVDFDTSKRWRRDKSNLLPPSRASH